MKRSVIVVIMGFLLVPLLADQETGVDRIEIKGGAVLTGHIESVGSGMIRLATPYAGTLSVNLDMVQQLSLGSERELDIPPELVARPVQKAPAVPQAQAPRSPAGPPAGTSEADYWQFEGGVNLSGKSGNSEKFDLLLRLEAEMERNYDRLNLYGNYAFGTNRGQRSSDEIIIGARYINFFLDQTGIFLRQEGERDEFEGIALRSTSAAGLTYQFRNKPDLRIEARAGLSYRYEDFTDDGSVDLPGMDIGLDLNWRLISWAHFKGSYTFLPSLEDPADYIFEQDTGFNLPLDNDSFWKIRFGISSQYNNRPDFGREKLDSRYYARLIAVWQ